MYRERIISFDSEDLTENTFNIDFKSFEWKFHISLEKDESKYKVESSVELEEKIGIFLKDSESTLKIRFISQKKEVEDVEKSLKLCHAESKKSEFGKFEIDESNFVADKQFHVKISVSIDDLKRNYAPGIDFSQPTNHSDVVLLVDGHRLHVNKAYLAMHSKYFDTLFFSDFKEATQEEIVLEGIIYHQFYDFLQQLYPGSSKVEKQSWEYLLMLADRFNVPKVFQDCEQYLINTSDVTLADKFIYADKWSMVELYGVTLNKLTIIDFRIIKHSSSYKTLKPESKAILLENLLDLILD